MPYPTREELSRVVTRSDYGEADDGGGSYYCEVRVHNSFHIEGLTSEQYDNRQMYVLKPERSSHLRSSISRGGAYICVECYLHLNDGGRPNGPSMRTRKSLRMSSKPPRVRRIPA